MNGSAPQTFSQFPFQHYALIRINTCMLFVILILITGVPTVAASDISA